MRRVADSIASIEQDSEAEVIVVVAGRSGSYEDVDLRWALLGAFSSLALLLFSPWTFPPAGVLLETGLSAALGWGLSRRLDPLRRLLTTPGRRREQAERAARAAFVDEQVSATRSRTGLLLYASLLEREGILVPDLELARRIPPSGWDELRAGLAGSRTREELEARLLQTLDHLQPLLARLAPASLENPNELPDEVRRRP